MHGILLLRCHARLKSRLRAAVMWQMHVINKPSFVLCSFQIIEAAIAVIASALDFTVCYDLTKVHFNSTDCLNTYMLFFITNQKWVWLLSDCWLIFAYLIHSIELLFFNTESWVSNIVTSYNIINSLVILPHTILYVKIKTVQSPHKINCAIL